MSDMYSILGVPRHASPAEIRKAYRKQALRNHPDKNPGDKEAEKRFLKTTEAFSILSDPAKRRRYDQNGGYECYHKFDFGSASDMFDANFGQALMRQWRPGLTVSGTLLENGKRISITIFPDGSLEEEEDESRYRGKLASYMSTTTILPNGGRKHTISGVRITLGQYLAAILVPDFIASLPLLGPVATTAVSWVPTVLVGCLALRIYGSTRREPGELPDSLKDAFAHL